MKFRGQPSLFPDEPTKVIYAGTRLEGAPFSWFSPLNEKWIRENNPPVELTTFKSFVKELTTLYRDPHLAIAAEHKICALRNTTSVAVYIAEFEEHHQYIKWNDEALRDQFYLGLHDKIKDNLAPLERPGDLSTLKELCLRIDARLNARWEEKDAAPSTPRTSWPKNNQAGNNPPFPSSGFPPRNPSGPTNPTPTPSSPFNAPKPLAPTRPPAPNPDGTIPMELGSRGGNRYKLLSEEKQLRCHYNLCGYCASPDHYVFACPHVPQAKRQAAPHPNMFQMDITAPASPPSSSSLSSSTASSPWASPSQSGKATTRE
jgi:hypothetical protein